MSDSNIRQLPKRVVDNAVEDVLARLTEIPVEEIAEVVILVRRKDGLVRTSWSVDDALQTIAYLEKLKLDLLGVAFIPPES